MKNDKNTITVPINVVNAVKTASRANIGKVPTTTKIPNKKRRSREAVKNEIKKLLEEL